MKRRSLGVGTVILKVMLLMQAASGSEADWPHWRGPFHNGSGHEMPLPAKLDANRSIVWERAMPGGSSATPVIGSERVFVVSNNESETSGHALCLDRETGQVLWDRELVHVTTQPRRNSITSCSPVIDDERMYFLFGTGELFALDHEGNPVWSKNLSMDYGPVDQQFGYSSSPLLLDGRLYIPVLHGQWTSGSPQSTFTDKDSYVLCLDARTGDVVWKIHRPSNAVGESFDSYASAIPYVRGDNTVIVVQGGNFITCHDPLTGQETFRQNHNPSNADRWRLIPSPVVAGILIVGVQPRGGSVFAIQTGTGSDLTYSDSLWIRNERSTDVPTPLYYGNRLYVLNGTRKTLTCLDPVNGREIWEGELGGRARFWASATAADGKIYCLNEIGEDVIVSAGEEFTVLSRAEFGGQPCKSSIALAHGTLFVRTAETLYRLGAGQVSE